MQIAFFSDIHANLPALEACLHDIDLKKPDAVYCLGDLVGYNIWPNEVIKTIRERKIPTIAGNYDFGIGSASNDCGCAYKTDEDKAHGAQSIQYTNKVVRAEHRQYLSALPAHIRLEYRLNDERTDLLMVHGSPRKINEYLFVDRDEKSLLRIMKQANATLCFLVTPISPTTKYCRMRTVHSGTPSTSAPLENPKMVIQEEATS